MSEALLVSNVLLWIAVLLLGALVLALLRQIGVLHERVAPAGALVSQRGPAVGERAPVLEVEDWRGAPLRIGGPADGTLSRDVIGSSDLVPSADRHVIPVDLSLDYRAKMHKYNIFR